MTSDYKKYSLDKLEEWMHDAMSVSEATPQEIYDVIKGVVEENYYCHKNQTSQAYELLALLNGNGKGHIESLENNTDDCIPFWRHSDIEYLIKNPTDKVVKWQLPVELDPSGKYFINFPDDLLEAANLKEGDQIEWVDNKDGSYIIKKCKTKGLPSHQELMNNGYNTYEEAVKDGWNMTDDGFWVKE